MSDDLIPIRPSALADAGRPLGIRIAAMARRLAELFRQVASGADASQRVDFLEEIARQYQDDAAHSVTATGTDAVIRLADAFALTGVDLDLLVLGGLPEEHEGFCDVLRALHPRAEPRATTALAARLLTRSLGERRALGDTLANGPLMHSGLLIATADSPFPERSLVVAESLWPLLRGFDIWPPALDVIPGDSVPVIASAWFESPDAEAARKMLTSATPITVLVLAEHEDVALDWGLALGRHAGVATTALAWPLTPSRDAARLMRVHLAARGTVPVLRVQAPDDTQVATFPVGDFPGPLIVCARAGFAPVRGARPVYPLPVEKLRAVERRRLWNDVLPEMGDESAVLAARYALEPRLAAEVALDVKTRARITDVAARLDDVADSVRVRSAVPLASGVALVRPRAAWHNLVLRPQRLDQLKEAVARLDGQARVLDRWKFLEGRPGARGVRMLFVGPPGTGKTLSAEVIASALGRDLLVADVSRLISKWIGDTPKNLARVFDMAERSTSVILFDEADALFGKRTEVSDAHDRYANLETAYLLSRLERFDGLAILATNLRQNIDTAFLRRLEFIVDFEEPGPVERERLWAAHVPDRRLLANGVNLEELAAAYPVTGALIRNAAVAAAFLAASEHSLITRRHLARALRREYEKAGRAFPGELPDAAAADRTH